MALVNFQGSEMIDVACASIFISFVGEWVDQSPYSGNADVDCLRIPVNVRFFVLGHFGVGAWCVILMSKKNLPLSLKMSLSNLEYTLSFSVSLLFVGAINLHRSSRKNNLINMSYSLTKHTHSMHWLSQDMNKLNRLKSRTVILVDFWSTESTFCLKSLPL